MRLLALTAALCLAVAAARADALSDKLCPILEDVAAGAGSAIMPEAVQANLVISVADAYDYDGEALRTVLADSDAAASAACPEARAAVLAAVRKQTLQEAMR